VGDQEKGVHVMSRHRPPPLSVEQILSWADEHKAQTGRWPHSATGPIAQFPGLTWTAVNHALNNGGRGLKEISTLARLLEDYRGKHGRRKPPLTEEAIVAWARAHFERTGRWPHASSGPVLDAAGEHWRAINTALYIGNRGLKGGDSLARLLERHRQQTGEPRRSGHP
jgi:hypothetical protein